MNQINAVTLGKLIAAHREGDEQKFKTYVDFIAKAYEEQGNDRAANIIRSNYTGDYAVRCNYCRIGTVLIKNEQGAIELWNHRTEVTNDN